jgi:hypothetical protein
MSKATMQNEIFYDKELLIIKKYFKTTRIHLTMNLTRCWFIILGLSQIRAFVRWNQEAVGKDLFSISFLSTFFFSLLFYCFVMM